MPQTVALQKRAKPQLQTNDIYRTRKVEEPALFKRNDCKTRKSSSTLERTQRRDSQTYQSLRFWQSNCHLSQLIIFGYRRESSGEPVRKSIHFSHKIHQNRHLASTRFGRFSHCEVTMTLARYLNCAGSGSSES